MYTEKSEQYLDKVVKYCDLNAARYEKSIVHETELLDIYRFECMAVLYIKEQGSYVKKQGECVIVAKGADTLLKMPVANLDNIAVIGNIQITNQALQMLMTKGVDVNYFTFSGKYLGHTAAEASKNIFLRLAQYEVYHNLERRMELARQIVHNKIGNQIHMIRNFHFQGTEYAWQKDVEKMEEYQRKLKEKQTSNEILGIEGICSNIYFGAFGRMFKGEIRFCGRNRRPPRDPINVMISLGYTFLTKEVSNALDSESFEMYLGFLHGIRYGRKSLALDIVEEFRQPVVDRLVIHFFNKRIFTEFDFSTEDDGILLNEDGFKKFCKEFERWMTDKSFAGNEMSFRSRIREQTGQLKRAIQNDKPYLPFRWEGTTCI